MSKIMINGVGYDAITGEFNVFATIKKDAMPLLKDGYNGEFRFSDQTFGEFYTFINRKGIRMLRVHGIAECYTFQIMNYLIERRKDVTIFMNSLLK